MKIKTNDNVLVIAGKDKGKKGRVIKALPAENKVIVEGVNIQTRHMKAKQDQPAEIRKLEGPIDASNVMLYDPKAKEVIKVGFKGTGKTVHPAQHQPPLTHLEEPSRAGHLAAVGDRHAGIDVDEDIVIQRERLCYRRIFGIDEAATGRGH